MCSLKRCVLFEALCAVVFEGSDGASSIEGLEAKETAVSQCCMSVVML